MIGNSFARLTGSKRNLLALMASGAVFTAGCSNMASTAPSIVSSSVAPAAVGGKIHGGNQPVVGATVKLYYAGQKSGFPFTLGATTTTDTAGSFAFTKDPDGTSGDNGSTNHFSCPTTVGVSPLVYVISTGGNTQNNGDTTQNNAAAEFISVFGACNTLTGSTNIDMTEVTTVATMAAYQGFFDPTTESISADGTAQQTPIITTTIPNTIALLANLTTGASVASTTLNASSTGNINPSVTVTATPEPGKVNLLANILSACINTATAASSACSSLFTAAPPPATPYTANFQHGTLPTATDTLQAIYYLLSNPTSGGSANIGTLFGLAGGVSGPYQPALATQPTDWTIAISFSSTSTCGSTSGGSGGFISGPIDINIDAADNVWIANSEAGSGNLSQISSGGVPSTCVFLGSGGSQGGATVDSAGNIWFGSGTNLYRYNDGTTVTFPTTVSPIGVTADGVGNVYFTAVTGAVGSLYRIANATTGPATAPVQISSNVGANPVRLMPDLQRTAGVTAQGNIFVSTGTTSVAEVSPSAGPGNLNGFVTTAIPTSGSSYGLTLGPQNNLFVSAIDSGVITGLTATSGYASALNGFPYLTPATIGIATPTSIAVDGRLNIWIPNNANGSGTGSVSELGSANIAFALSPSTGFQKSSTFLTSGRASVVDQAGNIWVAGDGANFITEIVGGGVPIFQPYALGLKNGRFQAIP